MICSGKIRKFQIFHALYHIEKRQYRYVADTLFVKLKIEGDVSMSPRQHFQVTK